MKGLNDEAEKRLKKEGQETRIQWRTEEFWVNQDRRKRDSRLTSNLTTPGRRKEE